ncbi:hypothetical protein EST38_g2677 [Candolleomyces aberdarensis]|uniref:5'-nucleotidase n=1 Tax=Candolleomyces aberdarensis TaxID=2316362 RepID=A0A4Q2DTZ3_9AGAR|nr:hypothetical protein EST38_g2677 [Candolleomyces aberdarensis]
MKTFLILSALLQCLSLVGATSNGIVVDRLVSRNYYEDVGLVKRGSGFANGGSTSNSGKDGSGRLKNKNNFEISFYHVNDVHAHLDQFRPSGSSCTDPSRGCVGGYPRIKSVIEQHRPPKKHSLFLNAGDEFQGTLFYTLYKGAAISSVLNQLGFDAMTLGNHEFDDGDDLLASFVANLTFPVITANIHTNNRKLARGLVPYKVFNKGKYRGMDLAIVAVTTETTKTISRPGEGTTFEDPVAAVKRTVQYIKRFHRDVKRIVALTHIGYSQDIRLAQETTDISLIVGGHSHTLLADNTTVPAAKGPYPTIVKNKKGEEVFVVTSYRWGEYLGYIDLEFDSRGRVVRYEGAPIHLTNTDNATKAEDPTLKAEVQEWAKGFEVYGRQIVGFTELPLDQTICLASECTLGDLTGDAIAAFAPSNTSSPINNGSSTTPGSGAIFAGAIMNGGGIRASIDGPANISLQQVLEVYPFGNTIVELPFTSTQLWNTFESIVSKSNVEDPSIPVTSFVQVSSSIRLTYDPNAAVGSRLKSLTVANGAEEVTKDGAKTYTVATIDYLAAGGDGFWPPRDPASYVTLDTLDQVFVNHFRGLGALQGRDVGSVRVELDGRISTTTMYPVL